MTQLHDDLIAVNEYLDAKGWCQGGGTNPHTAEFGSGVCLEEAIAGVITGRTENLWPLFYGENEEAWARDGAIHAALRVQRIKDAPDDPASSRSLWWWNDVPERTVEDVKLLLKRAIEACD